MAKNSAKPKGILEKANIRPSWRLYFVDAMGAMAMGLFASLLIGTIFNTIGVLIPNEEVSFFFTEISRFASQAAGAAMAGAIAYALQAPPLVLYSILTVGVAANSIGGAAGPLLIFFVAIISTEFGKLISKKTRLDILVTPALTIALGVGISLVLAQPFSWFTEVLSETIIWSIDRQALLMGIVISVLMGLALTLPISSAVIALALGLTGMAGGAALAGCCAQMIGFAFMSRKDNDLGGFFAQALGTSMLQMPNIIKNPKVLIPPVLASAVTGALATTVMRVDMNGSAIASGMGTSGLVGPIGVITGWLNPSAEAIANGAVAANPTATHWISLILISVVLPAILTLVFAAVCRRFNWIKDGDLKINS